MFCIECGTQIKEGAERCPCCGKVRLTKCKVCDHALSVEAENCPGCGQKTDWGWERERRTEALRKTERKKAEISRELSVRKTLMLIVLLLCIIEFAVGYCLLFEEYQLLRRGAVTSRAALGIFLMISAFGFSSFEVAHHVVRKCKLEEELDILQEYE
ncbi:MAG: zinc ribbon domain-containing protein [Lachnospiraceae bacterium]|nr:zinc ribbon domain-containing protein [Lachnospiraceae bacterium]